MFRNTKVEGAAGDSLKISKDDFEFGTYLNQVHYSIVIEVVRKWAAMLGIGILEAAFWNE